MQVEVETSTQGHCSAGHKTRKVLLWMCLVYGALTIAFMHVAIILDPAANAGKTLSHKLLARRVIMGDIKAEFGLGNQMFIVASAFGVSLGRGSNATWLPCVQPNARIWTVFTLEGVGKCSHHSLFYAYASKEKTYSEYDDRTKYLPTDRDVSLEGYRQSWCYFDNVSTEVRRLFSFAPEVEATAATSLRSRLAHHRRCELPDLEACTQNVTLVSVHVRRGDMMAKENREYGYSTVPKEWIVKAMNFFRRKHFAVNELNARRPLFIVVSDDMSWCRENIHGDDVIFLSGRDRPEVDLAILTKCQHSIVTVGSFGWWGAWLAGGSTVYYKDWPTPNTSLYRNTNPKDYFPPGWIGLSLNVSDISNSAILTTS